MVDRSPQLSRNISGREPMITLDQRILDLREMIEAMVVQGFARRYEIQMMVEDELHTFDRDLKDLPLERMIDHALRDHYQRQATWGVTDCDRLDAAFAALRERGIAAEQHFSCCGTCGSAEIWEYADRYPRGYVFYNVQTTESAAAGHGLYLSYGAFTEDRDGYDEAATAIGREVAEVLGEHGLRVEWNGSLYTRIGVQMDWKRRREVEALGNL